MNLPGDIETEILTAIGVEPRELVADPDLVPKEFRKILPPSGRVFAGGDIPSQAFGITGAAGSGKTCAMLSLLRLHLREAYKKRREAGTPAQDPKTLRSTYLWVEWPGMAHLLRTYAVENPEFVRVTVDRMCTTKLLLLDDLGAERRKGSYQDDYASGVLDYVIGSARYRACLPTMFTTNLPDAAAIGDLYGARFASRLLSDSPLVEMVGPDRRVAG